MSPELATALALLVISAGANVALLCLLALKHARHDSPMDQHLRRGYDLAARGRAEQRAPAAPVIVSDGDWIYLPVDRRPAPGQVIGRAR